MVPREDDPQNPSPHTFDAIIPPWRARCNLTVAKQVCGKRRAPAVSGRSAFERCALVYPSTAQLQYFHNPNQQPGITGMALVAHDVSLQYWDKTAADLSNLEVRAQQSLLGRLKACKLRARKSCQVWHLSALGTLTP